MQLVFLTLKEILDRALTAQCGITIKLTDSREARYARRRLYAEREKFRRAGDNRYNDLSLLIRNSNQLLIVNRKALLRLDTLKFQQCRELRFEELPDKIFSRGKSHPGIGIS